MGWEDETKFLANRFKKLPKTIQDTLVQKVKKFNLSFVISYQLEAVNISMDILCGSIC
ncbi:hypothetical protein RhiirA1_537392 [Rhizophagus irregularis]|uniref:Uncharacterized protein n=2 Tax=Rhizophagus irregularis TaxID=588596 RepID=A0A2N0RL09_9GLOM|nr:hypothetical protein RirG_258640 [Rhizophagus irregularis DAOM 197198w]PKC63965.1 hypothetical protein RhiirA1_537392 [Rhizophagus irregularis]